MAQRVVTVHEAKTHLSRLLQEVERGTDIVVARGRTPVARIVPIAKSEPIPMGFLHFEIPDSFFEPLPDEELAAWEGASGAASSDDGPR